MPRPAGWTAEQERKRDRCIRELLDDGLPTPRTAAQAEASDESRAYAICTAAIEHSRTNGNPDPMTFAKEVVAALRQLFV